MFDTSCPVGNFIPKQDIQDPHNIGRSFYVKQGQLSLKVVLIILEII